MYRKLLLVVVASALVATFVTNAINHRNTVDLEITAGKSQQAPSKEQTPSRSLQPDSPKRAVVDSEPDCSKEATRLRSVKRRLAQIERFAMDINSKIITEQDLSVIQGWTRMIEQNNREQENLVAEQLDLVQRMGHLGCRQSDMFGY